MVWNNIKQFSLSWSDPLTRYFSFVVSSALYRQFVLVVIWFQQIISANICFVTSFPLFFLSLFPSFFLGLWLGAHNSPSEAPHGQFRSTFKVLRVSSRVYTVSGCHCSDRSAIQCIQSTSIMRAKFTIVSLIKVKSGFLWNRKVDLDQNQQDRDS